MPKTAKPNPYLICPEIKMKTKDNQFNLTPNTVVGHQGLQGLQCRPKQCLNNTLK